MKDIGSLFDHIASHYDTFNHSTSLGIDKRWRRQAVRGILSTHAEALDVAIGTGDLAIELVRKGKARHVEGIDLSTEMMRIGQKKAADKGMQDAITFTKGSALEMPYADASFDLLTCAYGVRNFSNLEQGLKEMYRVLKPGGELMILEFSHPQNPVISALYTFYFKFVMSAFGAILTGGDIGSFTYFYHSVKRFVWGDAMLRKLEEAGFAGATYQTQTFGISTIYRAVKR